MDVYVLACIEWIFFCTGMYAIVWYVMVYIGMYCTNSCLYLYLNNTHLHHWLYSLYVHLNMDIQNMYE